jgi:Protein of unknown function (DUF3667)
MSGGEIVGDIAQGILTARAAEPGHGEAGGPGHTHEAACLNCGTALIGTHCHACGQAAHVHKTLGAFFHDLLHGVFHFEGKIWRTLPMLAWRPGRLTREYIDGRRASYVSPIALFLFSVFMLFAVIHAAMPTEIGNVLKPSVGKALTESRTEIATLEARRAKLSAGSAAAAALDSQIAQNKKELAAIAEVQARGGTELPKGVGPSTNTNFNSSLPWLNRALKHAQDNPDLLLFKVQSSAYKYSWLLIPISVPFVWLLFPFSRRFGVYDHTVFVTYSLCFMTILAVALSALGWIGAPLVGAAAVFLPPLHLYRQLREGYRLTRYSAIWRLIALLFMCTFTLVLFVLAVVSLGVT